MIIDNFTLIIPTYNRSVHLANLLRYFGMSKFDLSIMILDSSNDDEKALNIAAIQGARQQIEYLHYPNNVPFKEKLLDGLKRVKTELCAFCADDDLLIPEAINKCVSFLKSNQDYTGAHGHYFGFALDNASCLVDDMIYDCPSLDGNGPLERVAELFEEYQSNFYAVYRTRAQIETFEVAVRQESSLYFELMQSAYTATIGKIKRLPIVYAGRQRSPSADNPTHWHPVEWYSTDSSGYDSHFRAYATPLANRVHKSLSTAGNGMDRSEIENILRLIHYQYTYKSCTIEGLGNAVKDLICGEDKSEVVNFMFQVHAAASSDHPLARVKNSLLVRFVLAVPGLRHLAALAYLVLVPRTYAPKHKGQLVNKMYNSALARGMRRIPGLRKTGSIALRCLVKLWGYEQSQQTYKSGLININDIVYQKMLNVSPILSALGPKVVVQEVNKYINATLLSEPPSNDYTDQISRKQRGKYHPAPLDNATEVVRCHAVHPSVAIIIPNYNQAHCLENAIRQACEQTHPADEVIIIDDGSTDDSVKVIKSFQEEYSNLHLIESPCNEGPTSAQHRGLEHCTSTYVAMVAVDDILLPEFIEKNLRVLKVHPYAGLSFSNYAILDDESGEVKDYSIDWSMYGKFNNARYPEYISSTEFCEFNKREVVWMSSNTVMFKRELLQNVGGLNERAKWHCNWLLYLTMALRYGACVVPEKLAIIRAPLDSYSAIGLKGSETQRDVIRNIVDLVREPQLRDVYKLFYECPLVLSAMGDEVLKALSERWRDRYLWWRYYLAYNQQNIYFTKDVKPWFRRLVRTVGWSFGISIQPYPSPDLKPISEPTFGIVLANYNDAKYLRTSLPAMLNQTRPLDEIVIVDDGSSDDSVEYIQSLMADHPQIRLLVNEQNSGVIYSVNRALYEARADYVNWAASDDKVLPEFVEKSAAVLEHHPKSAINISELAVFSTNDEEFFPKRNEAFVFNLSGAPAYMTAGEAQAWHDSHILWISGNTTFLRREALVAMGGYRQKLEWHADWLVGVVFALRYGIGVVPEVLAGLRTKEGSYSSAGISTFKRASEVIVATFDTIKAPKFNDIWDLVNRYPCIISPLGERNLVIGLGSKVRFWPLLYRYIFWRISYNARLQGKSFIGFIVPHLFFVPKRIAKLAINQLIVMQR